MEVGSSPARNVHEEHHCAGLSVNINVIPSRLSILTGSRRYPNQSAIAVAIQARQEDPWAQAKRR